MSTIVLSSEPYCCGNEVARRVAQDLGRDCLGAAVEVAAASTFGASPAKLRRTLSPSTSRFALRENARTRHLAYFEAALLSTLVRGEVVYFGEVGHMFVADVSHIVKVRLTASLEERTARRAEAEGTAEGRAREAILKEDALRVKWFTRVFGADGTDPSLFDLVVNLSDVGLDGACSMIEETAREVRFNPVTYSVKALLDRELASRIRARLIHRFDPVLVTARDGEVIIRSKALSQRRTRKIEAIRGMLSSMEDVSYVVFE